MATETPGSSITAGNISGSSNVAIGHNAQVNSTTNIIQGYGELFTRYDTNVKNFLEYYVGTSEKPVPFGGRQQDLTVLDRWLADKQAPHYALLAAPAGRGKSALISQWVTALDSRADAPHIIFFPISLRFETHLASVAFAALAARAGYLFGEKVANSPDPRQYRGLFADFLRRPHPDGKPTLVVLDGLDEAANWTIGADVLPSNAPDHLKVLVAARPLAGDDGSKGWLNRLGWNQPNQAHLIPLHNLTKEGVQDVLKQMGNPLDKLAVDFDILEMLYHLTEGDPLLVRLYVDALLAQKGQAPLFRAEDIRNLEPGLTGFFKRWFEEQQKLWGDKTSLKDKGVRGLLNLCASAVGPLSHDDVLAIAPDSFEGDTFLLEEAAKDLNRFVIGDGVKAGYVFSHLRLREYFAGRLAEQQRRDWQDRFVNYGRNTLQALRKNKLAPRKTPPYVLQYYSAHLKNTDAPAEAFYELICQPWAQAWLEFDGTYSGFLNDIGRAWDIAEEKDDLYIQLLCALCFSSIASRSGNISPDLLALAVKEKILSIRQGLILVEQQSDFNEGFDKLSKFTEELTDDQLREGFELALNMGGWIPLWGPIMVALSNLETNQTNLKFRDFISLIPAQTWELAQRNLEHQNFFVQFITIAGLYFGTKNVGYLDILFDPKKHHEDLVGHLLSYLAAHLPSDFLNKAFEFAQTIRDENARARALSALAPRLPEPLHQDALQQALQATQNLASAFERDEALKILAPHLPPDLLNETFEATQNLASAFERDEALKILAPHLPPNLLDKAFEATQNLASAFERDEALKILAPHLPPNLLDKAFEATLNIKEVYIRAEMLSALVSHLPPDLLDKAFEATLNIKEVYRARILIALAPRLPEPLRQEALQKVLEAAQNNQDENSRAEALSASAPHLSPQLLNTAFQATQSIQAEDTRAKALKALAPYLPPDLLNKAFEVAQNILSESSRAEALTALAPYLPEPLRQEALQKALGITQNIRDEDARAQALTSLAPYLPPDLLNKALEVAQNILSESSRAEALTALAPHLLEPLRQEALQKAFEAAQNIRDEDARAQALTSLASYLPPDLLNKALEVAQNILSESSRAEALTALAPHLPEPLRQEALQKALEGAQNIRDVDARAQALTSLAPYLPPDLLNKALELTQNMSPYTNARAQALTSLAPYLPPDLLNKAFEVAQNILSESSRAEALTALAPYLPPDLLDKALEAVQNIRDEDARAQALTSLASYLPPDLLNKALEVAQNILSESSRAEALTALAPHLPEPLRQEALQKALEGAQNIRDVDARAQALTSLAPYLPPDLLNKALELTQNMSLYTNARAKTLSTLVLYISRESQEQLINEIMGFSETSLGDNREFIGYILFSLNNQSAFSHAFKKESIQKIIHQCSRLPRKENLELIPDIYKLACSTLPASEHKHLAEQLGLAIINVGEWWP